MEPENQESPIAYGLIYMATCRVNGKKYIGQTTHSLKSRMNKHYSHAFKLKYNNLFQLALRKHGWDAFEWSILAYCSCKADLYAEEIRQIANHKSIDREFGYNMTAGGTGGAIVESLPNKEEIYRKRGEANRGEKNGFYGKRHTPESLAKMSAASLGRKHSEEHRKKQSDVLKGRVFAAEHKAKISAAKTGAGNAMFGTKHSEEHKRKISESMKRYRQSKKVDTGQSTLDI